MSRALTFGGNWRRDLNEIEILNLPDDLHECAWGTWQPAQGWGNRAKDAIHGPRVDESGQRGLLWTVEHRGFRVLVAYHPDGRRAWALLDEDGDTLRSKPTHRETEAGFVLVANLLEIALAERALEAAS